MMNKLFYLNVLMSKFLRHFISNVVYFLRVLNDDDCLRRVLNNVVYLLRMLSNNDCFREKCDMF